MREISHHIAFSNNKIKVSQTIFYRENILYENTAMVFIKIITIDKNTNKSYYYIHSIYKSDDYDNTAMAFSYLSEVETQRTINSIWVKFMNIKRKLHPIFEWIITNDTLNALGNEVGEHVRQIEKHVPSNITCCSGYSLDFFENYDKGLRYLSNDSNNNKYDMDPIINLN
jgi:hypothetical protein